MAAVPHSARMLPHIKARPGVNSGRSLHGNEIHSDSRDIPHICQSSRTFKLCMRGATTRLVNRQVDQCN